MIALLILAATVTIPPGCIEFTTMTDLGTGRVDKSYMCPDERPNNVHRYMAVAPKRRLLPAAVTPPSEEDIATANHWAEEPAYAWVKGRGDLVQAWTYQLEHNGFMTPKAFLDWYRLNKR